VWQVTNKAVAGLWLWKPLIYLVNVLKKRWKDPPFFMGKSTINDIYGHGFISFLYVYQRVYGAHLRQAIF
jgi:hypothetical protein